MFRRQVAGSTPRWCDSFSNPLTDTNLGAELFSNLLAREYFSASPLGERAAGYEHVDVMLLEDQAQADSYQPTRSLSYHEFREKYVLETPCFFSMRAGDGGASPFEEWTVAIGPGSFLLNAS